VPRRSSVREMTGLLHRPRYADVVGTLALIVAMSGTAYAAHSLPKQSLPKNSVSSKQIKDNKVAGKDLKDGGITAVDLAGASVGSSQLQSGSVSGASIADGSVGAADLGVDSVGDDELAPQSVTTSVIGPNAVTGAKVSNESLTLADLVGADVAGPITFSVPANTCVTVNLTIAGAVPGQGALLTLTDNTALNSVVLGPLRVSSPDAVSTRACNVSGSAVAVSGLEVRVITFG